MSKPVFNAHAHIFDFRCVPNHMSDKWYLKWVGTSGLITSKFGKLMANNFQNTRSGSKLARAANFLAIGLDSTQDEIFELLQKSYADMGDMRFVILPMDMHFMEGGTVPKPYRQQLQELIKLRVYYPDKMLPFLGIHPDRFRDADETLAFVQDYIGPTKPFVGIKMYPATGYYPDDPRLMKMYEFAQAHSIPITSHCTHGPTHYLGKIPKLNTATVANRKFFHPKYYTIEDGNIKTNKYYLKARTTDNFQDNWTNPYIFRETVLKEFPDLKINFAHFGGATRMAKYYNGDDPETNWYGIVRQMLTEREGDSRKYPNVYTDISYTLTKKNAVGYLLNDIRDTMINDRILFGTDFYVVSVEQYERSIKKGFLQALNNEILLRRIATANVKEFLSSSFFTPI